MGFAVSVLVAGILLALGFAASQWLGKRFQSNLVEEKNRAYRDAFVEAQARIRSDFDKSQRDRQTREGDELRMTGVEDIQTYEQSLRNLGHSEEQIAEMLKERHRM